MVRLWAISSLNGKKYDLGMSWGRLEPVAQLAEAIIDAADLTIPDTHELAYEFLSLSILT